MIDETEEALEQEKEILKKENSVDNVLDEFISRIDQIMSILKEHRSNFASFLESLKVTKRSKRFIFDPFTKFAEDIDTFITAITGYDEEIVKKFDELRVKINKASETQKTIHMNAIENIQAYKRTNAFFAIQNKISEIILKLDIVMTKCRAIFLMLQRRRLSSVIVDFSVFNETLVNITNYLGNEESMPYPSVNEYFYNLEMTHYKEDECLILSLKVPFVEKRSFKLYKIHELPSRKDDALFITNVHWKYFAVDAVTNDKVLMMKNLDSCLVDKNLHFCEPQSPIITKMNNTECLINAYENHKIDFNSCQTTVTKFPNLVFIKLGSGEYFYFKQKKDDVALKIKCNGNSSTENLTSQSGILKLEQGCIAITDKNKLISTKTYSKSIHTLIKVHFDNERLGQSYEELLASFPTHEILIQNEENLRQMSKFKLLSYSIDDFEKPTMATGDYAMIALASLILIVFSVVVAKETVIRMKNKRTQEKIVELDMKKGKDNI